jgi:hypothetical protein
MFWHFPDPVAATLDLLKKVLHKVCTVFNRKDASY